MSKQKMRMHLYKNEDIYLPTKISVHHQ